MPKDCDLDGMAQLEVAAIRNQTIAEYMVPKGV